MSHLRQLTVLGLRVRSPACARPFSTVKDIPITAGGTVPFASTQNVLQKAMEADAPRTNWTKEEISAVYNTPLFELQYAAVSASSDDEPC
jgi:biotin synthase